MGISNLERFDQLKVKITQMAQVDRDQVKQLLYDLLLLETRRCLLRAIVVDVETQDLDEPLLGTVHGLVIVERRVLVVEQDYCGEEGELRVAQLKLAQLTNELEILLHKAQLLFVEIEQTVADLFDRRAANHRRCR